MSVGDPYEVLEVPYGSSRAEVRSAWRAAARKWHPDANPDDAQAAAEKFAQARQAYQLLMSTLPEEEEKGSGVRPERAEQEIRAGAVPHDPFAMHAGESRRGENLNVILQLDLDTAWWGGKELVYLEYSVPCPACAGTGASGCECAGSGQRRVLAWQEVTVPERTADGTVLHMPRRGGSGWGGQTPGDLEVRIRVSDPVWAVRGRELLAELRVSTALALMGGRLDVPHPAGSIAVDLPAGSISGWETVLPDAGLGASATIRVHPSELNLSDPRVKAALVALDKAERGI